MLRNKRMFVAVACLILAAGVIFVISGCGRNEANGKASQGKATYYCPMHPTYTSDRPGDCPICNMKLVKKQAEPAKESKGEGDKGHKTASLIPAVEKTLDEICLEHKCTMNNCPMSIKADIRPGERIACPICGEVISTANGKVVEIAHQPAAGGGTTVMISPERRQMIGVTTEPVQIRDLAKIVRVSGKIAYDPELVVTQEEFIQALKNEENVKDSPIQDVIDRAKSLADAARNKLKLLGMSNDQITGLENTKKAQTNLYLPGKGENVWAYISVYEYEIGLVKIGSLVDMDAVAYPGEIFQGRIVSVSPVLDPAARTNQVRVEVVNTLDRLKPEMFVNAKIKVDLGRKLAVPEAAIMDTGLRKIAYLSREGDVMESREVSVGQKVEGYYEVLSGLKEGDIVVISGNFLIDSESRLKSAASDQSHQHGQ